MPSTALKIGNVICDPWSDRVLLVVHQTINLYDPNTDIRWLGCLLLSDPKRFSGTSQALIWVRDDGDTALECEVLA